MKILVILLILMVMCAVVLVGWDQHYAGRVFQVLMTLFCVAVFVNMKEDFLDIIHFIFRK